MTFPTARVLKATQVPAGAALPKGRVLKEGPALARVLPRAVHEATLRAKQLIGEGESKAARIVKAAEQAAGEIRLQAEAQGRAQAIADLAAEYILLSELRARASEAGLDRSIELAKLLAEKLVGDAFTFDETRVASRAREILAQLRSAKALRVTVHPGDQQLIAAQLQSLGVQATELSADPSLQRGELCIDSELGRVEARIGPALDRLAARLKSLLADEQ